MAEYVPVRAVPQPTRICTAATDEAATPENRFWALGTDCEEAAPPTPSGLDEPGQQNG